MAAVFGAGNEKSRGSAPRVLIPGGQAIGVAIRTQGVLVVGAGDNGRDSLREGDMILSVNGVPLLESAMLTEAVNAALTELAQDGTLAEIASKWFSQDMTIVGK